MDTIRAKTEDLASRVAALTALLAHLEEQVQSLSNQGGIAPPRCWITRYQARGQTKNYWYYKWQSQEPVFPTESGKSTRSKHLGKAGSQAYLEAVTSQVRRATFFGLQQAISTLRTGLADLSEEQGCQHGSIIGPKYSILEF